MAKMIGWRRTDPSSGRKYVVRGNDEEEVLRDVAEHGIHEVTPEMLKKFKAAIRNA